jgi:hypothetical protein
MSGTLQRSNKYSVYMRRAERARAGKSRKWYSLNFLKLYYDPTGPDGFTQRCKVRKRNKGPSFWPSLRPLRTLRLCVKPRRGLAQMGWRPAMPPTCS